VISLFNPATNTEMFFIMHVPAGTILPGTEITLLPQQPLQSMTPRHGAGHHCADAGMAPDTRAVADDG
jgi:hypothetical protein